MLDLFLGSLLGKVWNWINGDDSNPYLIALATVGYIIIKILNHRSEKTSFRFSFRDGYQLLEFSFFGFVLAKGLGVL
jgi:hypothetical protein